MQLKSVPRQAISHAFPNLVSLQTSERYCLAKTKVGRNWYQSTGIALVLGRWTFFLILKGHHLGFYKNNLPPLEYKLLVMLGRIVVPDQEEPGSQCRLSESHN
jgi:hypothetical protein